MTTEAHIVPQWSEAEMDQIQDFLGTVHGWKAGRVLSQGDIDDIFLYLRYEDTEGESAVDAYHEGVAKGRRDTLSPDDAATMERLEKLSGDLCVERATAKAMALYHNQDIDKLCRILAQQVSCIGNLAKKLGYSEEDIAGMTESATAEINRHELAKLREAAELA